MRILAIDPGKTCGMMIGNEPFVLTPREALSEVRRASFNDTVLIEGMTSYGTEWGNSIGMNLMLIGRLIEAGSRSAGSVYVIPRVTIRAALCGDAKVGDSEIMRRLIQIHGGEEARLGVKCGACGNRKPKRIKCQTCGKSGYERKPTWLGRVKEHAWAALALAECFSSMPPDRRRQFEVKE